MISVEFVDSLVGNSELYSQRVNRFFDNSDMTGYSEEIKNNYYVDVFSSEISIDIFKQMENQNIVELDKIFDLMHR